ncbi:MAG: peptidoglycan DD-metalloendopeptidase family protein [Gordonia sp. (in: high G+C Gram-positive bacteria)]|uniref:M23 family metallopeptidase n=1 Tax=Gordonia sp. (in: high G+C Gram-positive bacteria) TaxID=84139 RepID=UPI0039E348B7
MLSTVGGAATAAPRGPYEWPLAPRPSVERGFDPPAQRWRSGHRGVDLGAAPDAAVLAAGAGTVRFAGTVGGRPTVSVLHPDGIITTYEPVRATVRAGETVVRGRVLGYLDAGHAGCPAAACLHWGARRGAGRTAEYLDPLALVGAVRVRLKPVGDRPG